MEMAKVTSKGQVTIPVSIRRSLGINEGDKLLFLEKPDGVMMVNPNMLQVERFDELVAAQPPAADDQISAVLSGAAGNDLKKPDAQTEKGESKGKPSGDFDVASLLNDIRSMGSKI